MTTLKTLIRAALVLLRLIRRPAFVVRHSEEQPTLGAVAASELFIVGPRHAPKWACFRCPGGCATFLRLPLSTQRRPHWRVETDWLDRPTVSPSVHQKSACHAHFWIKRGAVVWCGDNECGPRV